MKELILKEFYEEILGKCPLTYDGVFGLSNEHDITNIPCGRILFV